MRSEKISAKELFNAIDQIYEEKGITKEYLIESLKMALEAAYKKNYETNEDILIKIDENSIKVCAVKQVVETVEDSNTQVTLEDEIVTLLISGVSYDINLKDIASAHTVYNFSEALKENSDNVNINELKKF